MANVLNSNPVTVDTDLSASSFQASATAAGSLQRPLRVKKIALIANAATVAGTVAVTALSGDAVLPPIAVAASLAADSSVYTTDFARPLYLPDFKVTGLTATHTTLYVWYE